MRGGQTIAAGRGSEQFEIVERPQSQQHLATNQMDRNDAEIAAIAALRSIIPHHEQVVRLDLDDIAGSIGEQGSMSVFFGQGLAIEQHLVSDQLDSIATDSDDSFDQVLGWILGRDEDDQISTFDLAECRSHLVDHHPLAIL